MRSRKIFLAFAGCMLMIVLIIVGCNKDDEPDKDSELISFTGLVADMDSLAVGESTLIRAVYEGKGVVFEWEASSGDILGNGDKVEYLVAFCDIGINTITCKASAENTTITKSINIKVYVQ